MQNFEKVQALLQEFKKGKFIYGEGCLDKAGEVAVGYGNTVLMVSDRFPGSDRFTGKIKDSVSGHGVQLKEELKGVVRPNAPVEDMLKVKNAISEYDPDVVISFGGGSTIDAVKAAIALDEAIVPQSPVFDYEVTYDAPKELTLDGALDGMSHCMEVYFGSVGKPHFEKAGEIASVAIELIIKYLPDVMRDPSDKEARNALCAATDLGGYAIMVGGTSGAHLTSFSLVDVTTHGRACAVLNPYYAVFYAPAIEEPLRVLGNIYQQYGYSDAEFRSLKGRDLGIAFAKAMLVFADQVGFPTRLSDFSNFKRDHIEKALEAAKNPQLQSKLENMPVPLTADLVDEYMGSILYAAESGELEKIKNLT